MIVVDFGYVGMIETRCKIVAGIVVAPFDDDDTFVVAAVEVGDLGLVLFGWW